MQPATLMQEGRLDALMTPAAADAAAGLVASMLGSETPGQGKHAGQLTVAPSPPATATLHLCLPAASCFCDRTESAQLALGNLEYGYFLAAMEQMCQLADVPLGGNSDTLLAMASDLPLDEVK